MVLMRNLLMTSVIFLLSCNKVTEADIKLINAEDFVGSGVEKSTVAMLRNGSKKSCSGTLIAPQLILTAAHCVYKGADAPPNFFEVYFGTDTNYLNESAKRKVIDIIYHSGYTAEKVKNDLVQTDNMPFLNEDGTVFDHEQYLAEKSPRFAGDIALMIFEGTTPPGYSPAKIGTNVSIGDNVMFAAFGSQSFKSTPDKPIRSGELKYLDAKIGGKILNKNGNSFIVRYTKENSGACFGDSGGPIYKKNSVNLEIIGLVSGGPDPCTIFEVITDLQSFKIWIERNYDRSLKTFKSSLTNALRAKIVDDMDEVEMPSTISNSN